MELGILFQIETTERITNMQQASPVSVVSFNRKAHSTVKVVIHSLPTAACFAIMCQGHILIESTVNHGRHQTEADDDAAATVWACTSPKYIIKLPKTGRPVNRSVSEQFCNDINNHHKCSLVAGCSSSIGKKQVIIKNVAHTFLECTYIYIEHFCVCRSLAGPVEPLHQSHILHTMNASNCSPLYLSWLLCVCVDYLVV